MALKVGNVPVVALRTTTGTQDFTISGFGTPTGYLVYLSEAVVNNTETADSQLSIGMSDGTRSRVVSSSAVDGVTTEDTQAESQNASVALLCTPGTPSDIVRVDHSAFITDGVRLNVAVTNGVAYLITVVLFTGCTCEVADVLITGIGTEATATLGHSEQVKAVIAASCGSATNSATANTMRLTMGVARYDSGIAQRAISHFSGNGTATSRQAVRYASDRVAIPVISNTGAETFGGEMTTMTTGSIGITGRGVSASDRSIICLCLSGFSESVFVGDINTATGTGSSATTGLGFQPQAIVGVSSILSSASVSNGGNQAGGFGVFAWDRRGPGPSSVTNHFSITGEDNVGTMRQKTWSNNVAIESYSETGALLARATLTSFDSDGFTLDWTTVDATARRNIYIAFGEAGAATGNPWYYYAQLGES